MTMRISMTSFVSVLLLCASAHPDSITLKHSVRLIGKQAIITLADIANVQGERAAALAELPIATLRDDGAALEIQIQDVRAKLDDAGVNWGQVNLSGRSVVIRPARSADAAPPQAMSAVAIESHEAETIR